MERDIITIITQVLVNKDDPAFEAPTKPIGPYYAKAEADKFMKNSSSIFKEDKKRGGWRKVVASPRPLVISNKKGFDSISLIMADSTSRLEGSLQCRSSIIKASGGLSLLDIKISSRV